MNISLLVGIVVSFGLVVFGIGFDSLGNFIDVSSIIIVIGCTLASMISATPMSQLGSIPKYFGVMFTRGSRYNPADFIDQIVECAKVARTNGLLALEEYANNQEDPFFKESLLLIVDAIDADKIKERLQTELDNLDARHAAGIGFFQKGSALAPAMGMVGTLIGLINMLKSMDFDSGGGAAALAQNMSVALITTFYGSILANMIFTPMSMQLQEIHNAEVLCKEIIIEGILAVQAGENPKFIREKLLSFLSDKDKEALAEDTGGAG